MAERRPHRRRRSAAVLGVGRGARVMSCSASSTIASHAAILHNSTTALIRHAQTHMHAAGMLEGSARAKLSGAGAGGGGEPGALRLMFGRLCILFNWIAGYPPLQAKASAPCTPAGGRAERALRSAAPAASSAR